MILTIDGPAGTGKTTVAKKVAQRLNLPYFDTGAMYRAVAYLVLKQGIRIDDEAAIMNVLEDFDFQIDIQNPGDLYRYFVNHEDITQKIRALEIGQAASKISTFKSVREKMWMLQKRIAKKRGGVFEGRDIGSMVFPQAKIKIFLTANLDVRASRRLKEIEDKDFSKKINKQTILEQIQERDTLDSTRSFAPLICPPDAYVIDTSFLTIEEVVQKIIDYKEKKSLLPVWLQFKRMKILYRLVLCLTWCWLKIFYRLKIYGKEHYYPQGAVLAANHTSFLDPPIIGVSWPEEIHFLARQSLFNNWFFSKCIKALNAHPISQDGTSIHGIKTVCALIEEGKKVVLFPEGARSIDGNLQSFKSGVALIVSRTKSAVIPIYIQGSYEAWSRKRKRPRLLGKIFCVIGSPILWSGFQDLDTKQAQQALIQKLESGIINLKKWLEEGAKGIPP